jgi:hypothetical protein
VKISWLPPVVFTLIIAEVFHVKILVSYVLVLINLLSILLVMIVTPTHHLVPSLQQKMRIPGP